MLQDFSVWQDSFPVLTSAGSSPRKIPVRVLSTKQRPQQLSVKPNET